MGCVKLHILDEQYRRTELKVSYDKKELTSIFCAENTYRYYLSGLPWKSNTGDNPSAQPYKAQSKEFIEMHGYDTYDFHARMYVPSFVRTTTMDPLAEMYYSISPYAWCLNNFVNAIDTDGRRVVFINGYLGFGSPDGGKAYWNSSFISGAQRFFNDNTSPYFTDVKHGMLSSASGRQSKGYTYAKENYTSLIEGVNEGETFKLVSHSMGGAFSTGVKKYLEEQGWAVESSVFINTFQSDKVKNSKDGTFVVDYQNTNDPVLFWFDSNLGKGQIKNSDIQIRVKSDEKTGYIHRSPIDSGKDFWEELRKTIDDIFNK